MQQKILVLEDDLALSAGLCFELDSAGYLTVAAYNCQKARQLLKEGVSVQQAGELSGFSDNSHFIRTFGHLTGTSPGRYAREHQGSDAAPILGSSLKE